MDAGNGVGGAIVKGKESRGSTKQNGQDIEIKRKLEAAAVPTLQDLELQIEALKEVNAHLNTQIEKSTREIDTLKDDRNGWKKRAKVLVNHLNRMKKTKGGNDSDIPVLEEPSNSEVEEICERIVQEEAEESFKEDGVDVRDFVYRGKSNGWLIDPSEVHLGVVIGEGAFGTTYRGVWRGAFVAVKTVTVITHEDKVSFLREVEVLANLRHPNVLPFLGACINMPDKCWLICEYMEGGTLARWLHGDSQGHRSIIKRLQLALEVARGMEACERNCPPILHRDLKPSNVFIDGSGQARVADFGLARRLLPETRATMTSETGTYVYMSPEMIRHEVYDTKTDIWSWGVLLCELVNQALPYCGTFMTPIQVAMAVSNGKLKPEMPSDIHPGLSMLAEMCFMSEPAQRPTFEMIVSQLAAVIKDISDEINANSENQNFLQRIFKKDRNQSQKE